jgi:general secretion pathway protein A
MSEVEPVLAYFGLREQPFSPTADPAYMFVTPGHKECLYRLWNHLDGRHGIALVLGGYGTGKTTLLRKVLTGMRADPRRYCTAVIGSPVPSWTTFALLEKSVEQFGLAPGDRSFGSYLECLNQFLIAQRDRVTTLIIDDAQNLNKRGQIELLRLVQNLETAQHKLLNLVLFAQLEWIPILKAVPQFEQRINLTYTLEPLTLEELQRVVAFRLEQAGATDTQGPVFEEQALRIVHAYGAGSPRVTVTLCRNSLLMAMQQQTRQITEDIVVKTIERTTLPDRAKRSRVEAALTRPHAWAHADAAEEPVTESIAPAASRPMRGVVLEAAEALSPEARRDARARDLLLRGSRGRDSSTPGQNA